MNILKTWQTCLCANEHDNKQNNRSVTSNPLPLAVLVHIIASSLSFLPKFLKVIILEEIGHLNCMINDIGHQGLACHWEVKLTQENL